MSTLPRTPFTRVSNLFLIELILVWAIIIGTYVDIFVYFQSIHSKFGFRIGGAVFETLSTNITNIWCYVIAIDIDKGLVNIISFINTRYIIY